MTEIQLRLMTNISHSLFLKCSLVTLQEQELTVLLFITLKDTQSTTTPTTPKTHRQTKKKKRLNQTPNYRKLFKVSFNDNPLQTIQINRLININTLHLLILQVQTIMVSLPTS